jgi:hypothetical protein
VFGQHKQVCWSGCECADILNEVQAGGKKLPAIYFILQQYFFIRRRLSNGIIRVHLQNRMIVQHSSLIEEIDWNYRNNPLLSIG